jgi:hypothetical protein
VEFVTSLKQNESVRLDPDRMADLFSQLGQHAAEDVVCRALEEMAARLTHIDKSYRASDWGLLGKNARGLGAIADQLGITMLARVARDVKTCTEQGDPVALAATLARLMRVGESSLTEFWMMQEF